MDNKSIEFNETILILLNYIEFKNPISAYELTNGNENIQDNIHAKFELANNIEKDYIRYITYIDDEFPNNEINFTNYYLYDKKTLIIPFTRPNSPKNYIFYIYPEYDKKNERNGVQKVYLYFQDYLLLTDAIYIKRNNSQESLVYFQVRFKDESYIKEFFIRDNSNTRKCQDFSCKETYCNYIFLLGYKSEPEILTIEYKSKTLPAITQKRNIFLILYETNILQCYIKSNSGEDLEIINYCNEEMEYDNFLYFNDTAKKSLTRNKKLQIEKTKINFYSAKLSSLNTGTFAIFSYIPELNNIINSSTNINPVDDYSLYLTIYPENKIIDNRTSIIFTNNETSQTIDIFSTNAEIIDKIILKKKNDMSFTIPITKTEEYCILNNTNLSCNLVNMIYDYKSEYNGEYFVYYTTKCAKIEYEIKSRTIIIKRNITLLDLTPKYILENEVNGKTITLKFDDNLNEKLIMIYLCRMVNNSKQCELFNYFNNSITRNEYVDIKLINRIEAGDYYIKILSDNEKFEFNHLNLKIIPIIKDFWFNHHYFVLHNNATVNHLIIKVNDKTNTFGCKIIETTTNLFLETKDCKTFYYNISIISDQIKFKYYFNETNEDILIPINQSISVFATHEELFIFPSLKNCYYYKFGITIQFYRNLPKYQIFFK